MASVMVSTGVMFELLPAVPHTTSAELLFVPTPIWKGKNADIQNKSRFLVKLQKVF
jgi:hypothetical protein